MPLDNKNEFNERSILQPVITNTNEGDEDESFDLDDLLPIIGEFGKYQKLLVFGICLPACIPCGFCAFNQLFMADTPEEYWCKVPELLNHTTKEQRKFLAIPNDLESNDNGAFSKCQRYAVNWTEILEDTDINYIEPNVSWPLEACKNGWEYNTSEIWSSIVIDFDLVCERDIYPTIGLAALNVGGPIGVYLFGLLNDRAGRRTSYFSCLTTLLAGSLMTSLSTDFWMWAGSRVIVGLTIPAVYQIPFIISLELVGENYRSFVTVMTCVTYLERDWVKLSYYTSVPFYAYFLYLFVMPESPRWLLMRGRLEEALKVLQTMARVNGHEFPADIKSRLEAQISRDKLKEKKKHINVGLPDLCRTPNMRLKTILITLSWFANETVYLGLSYYGPSLGSNQYLSFFLSAVVEIPSYLVCWFLMDCWGRRWPLSLSMILGGLACVITVMVPDAAGKENLKLPLVIMGFVSVLGGFTSLRLPETLHHRLPQTIDEGEEFGKDWSFNECCSCKAEPQVPSQTASYENLDVLEDNATSDIELEMKASSSISRRNRPKSVIDERTPLDNKRSQRLSKKRLVRQMSVMDTQKTEDGIMQLTHWI
uniref:Major facilitator superfamily (MFS) profile domain-containing protein n=1 Tax=Glossina palpalis gambiensis TaxID=67801 RepID=A0A1B0BDQ4_9MUSC